MGPSWKVLVISCVCLAVLARAVNYQPVAKRLASQPIMTFQKGQSIYEFNYNAAYIPSIGNPHVDGLLVRAQNYSNNVSEPMGPSVLALSAFNSPEYTMQNITEDSIVLRSTEPYETYGTEDPRIAYREQTGTYYLTYSAVQANPFVCRLALATTQTPSVASSWVKHGPVFADCMSDCPNNQTHWQWTKSAAILIRDDVPGSVHYMIFGDSSYLPGIQLATSNDLLNWTVTPGIFIPVRNDSFDSLLVEGGPPPMRLSDGNYFFIYNSARHNDTFPDGFQYNLGWVILDKDDPSKILQRAEEPLFSPELAWELGVAPYLGLTPNVVFCEGMKANPNGSSNSFIIFYGAADSVIGVAQVDVYF